MYKDDEICWSKLRVLPAEELGALGAINDTNAQTCQMHTYRNASISDKCHKYETIDDSHVCARLNPDSAWIQNV